MGNTEDLQSTGINIDLDMMIDKLMKRMKELEKVVHLTVNPDEITELTELSDQLNKKWKDLSKIASEKEASEVYVNGITNKEKSRIKVAMAELSITIQKEQVFKSTLDKVSKILSSAEIIYKASQGYTT